MLKHFISKPLILKFSILGALDRFMLIYSVYIMFFSKIGLNPAMIGFVLAVYESGKILGDPLFATLSDKYGRKYLIIIGFILKAVGVSAWVIYPGITSAFVGVVLIGLGKSGTNNIEPYMYDEFKANGYNNEFKNAIAVKSIITNISASLGGLTASFLYKAGNFDYVFKASIFIIIFLSIPYITIFLTDKKEYTKNNIKKPIFLLAKDGFKYLRSEKRFMYSVILVSIFYSTYIMYTDANKMIMNNIGFTPDLIARIYSIAHIVPVLTTILFLICRPGLLIKGVVFMAIMIWIGIGVSAFIFYGRSTVMVILVFLFLFPIFDTCIKDNMHRLILDSSIRSTVVSFSHLLSSAINIVGSLYIGLIANNYSYSLAIGTFSIIMSSTVVLVMIMQILSVKQKIIN